MYILKKLNREKRVGTAGESAALQEKGWKLIQEQKPEAEPAAEEKAEAETEPDAEEKPDTEKKTSARSRKKD